MPVINKCCSSSNLSNSIKFPDCKLQSLDVRIGAEQLYCDKEHFSKSLNLWDNIPIIYNRQGNHPNDFEAVAKNPAEAAKKEGGELVGYVSNPQILVEGDPRLMATLVINNNESEILKLYNEGKLFPSTAFSAFYDADNKLTSAPIPNHVLLFERKIDEVLPGDLGAYIHTQKLNAKNNKTGRPEPQNGDESASAESTAEAAEESKFYTWLKTHILNYFKSKDNLNSSASEPAGTSSSDQQTKNSSSNIGSASTSTDGADQTTSTSVNGDNIKMDDPSSAAAAAASAAESNTQQSEQQPSAVKLDNENKLAAIEKIISDKQIEIDALKAKLEEQASVVESVNTLKAKLEKYEQAERDAKFEEFMNSIPAGRKATDEMRNELRTQWDADPVSVMLTILAESKNSAAGATQPTGTPFVNTDPAASEHSSCTSVGDLCGGK